MTREALPRELQIVGMRTFIGNVNRAVQDVRRFRDQARHHRTTDPSALEPPTLVASAGLGMNLSGDMRWFWAANQNLAPGDNPTKMCSERIVLQKMVTSRFDYLIGMVTSGTPQPDTQSGRRSLILPTCGICRPYLTEYGDEAYTLNVQSHPNENIHEIDKLSELNANHANVTDPTNYTVLDAGNPDFGQFIFEIGTQGLLTSIRPDASVADVGRYAIGAQVSAETMLYRAGH